VIAGESLRPYQRAGTPAPSLRRKVVICNTTGILQGVMFPAYAPLRKTAEAPKEKKTQNPNYCSTGIKTLTKTKSTYVNLNVE
jgi:hypothetical protein